jgi:hypothetical protein
MAGLVAHAVAAALHLGGVLDRAEYESVDVIEDGPPLNSLLGDSRSVSPEEALLHCSPLHERMDRRHARSHGRAAIVVTVATRAPREYRAAPLILGVLEACVA